MWYFQALATGVSLACGYGVGLIARQIFRWSGITWRPSAEQRRWGWIGLGVAAAVLIPLFMILGAHWQKQTRALIGVDDDSDGLYILVLLIALIVAIALIQLARGIGALWRRIAEFGRRWVPLPVAKVGGLALLVILGVALLDGAVARVVLNVAERSYFAADQNTRPGVVQPVSPKRSGSPESLEHWSTLGRDGRSFVAAGPDQARIEEVTGKAAEEPIRVYSGRASAETIAEIADNVVAELDRTRAFDRTSLLVVTTTGRGWVNTAAADAFEYINHGDSAIAAMQYSHLQSPFAYLADRQTPLQAGRLLLEAVYERWSQLPEASRPKLYVMGESLGSYGMQGAVSSPQDMISRLNGGLLIGTPNFAEPWHRLTEERDPGSREILPVVDHGRHVRFAAEDGDLELSQDWEAPRFVYWQHASDPITWWSLDLIYRRPDWLAEPLGSDVNPNMRWLPLVTFWQVAADMALSAGVPAGHGHAYGDAAAGLWAAILDPEGWEESDTDRVREAIRSPETQLQPLGEIH